MADIIEAFDMIKAQNLHTDVSNVNFRKFSHNTTSYTLCGENFNIMLGY